MAELPNGSVGTPPRDAFNIAYFLYFLLGASYLVPWNAFITAIDYFELLYPWGQIDRVFSIVYMVPAVITIFALTFLGVHIPASKRVNAGLVLFIAMLVLVPSMNSIFISDSKGTAATYGVTIAAAMVTGFADSLVQGSIVGSTGELPPRYMQALMTGTAAAGVLVSFLRIITKAVMPQTNSGTEASAYLYFIVSVVIMIACIVSYNLSGRLPVIKYYNQLKEAEVESRYLLDPNAEKGEHGLSKKSHGKLSAQKLVSYKHVWGKIQGYAISIALIYLVTLSIFPGHITEDMTSSFFGDWYGILLTLCYNGCDFIGKALPGFPIFMSENKALAIGGSIARVVFFPLYYLCLHGPTFFQLDAVVMIITCFLGLTNGYYTTLLLILAPKSVPLEEAEVAGILMVALLLLGLASGSILEWIWVL